MFINAMIFAFTTFVTNTPLYGKIASKVWKIYFKYITSFGIVLWPENRSDILLNSLAKISFCNLIYQNLRLARLLSILAMTRSSNASTASSTPGQVKGSQTCFMLYEYQDWILITDLQNITLAGGSGRLKIWKTQFSGHRSPSVWRHRSKTLQVHLEQKHASISNFFMANTIFWHLTVMRFVIKI